MAIQWRDHLAVGVPEIDEQHQELFRRFNDFLKACDGGEGAKKILDMLRYLDTYVVEHFDAEERMQKKCGYPGIEQHRADHRYFIYKLGCLKEHAENKGLTLDLVLTANRVLVRWLVEHVSGMDRAFGQYLKEQHTARHEHWA